MFAVAAAVIVVAWIYVAVGKLGFLPSGYPSWLAKMALLQDCPADAVYFFGNSRVEAGIMPGLIGPSVNNVGFAGGTPLEISTGVRHALACNSKPKLVAIAIDPSMFGPASRDFWIESIGYGFQRLPDILALEREADRIGDRDTLSKAKTPDGLTGRVRDWLYAAQFPPLYFASLVKGQIFRRYHDNAARYASVLQARGFVPYPIRPPSTDAGPEAGMQTFEPTRLQAELFEQTLDTLRQQQVPVVLFSMPIKRVTRDRIMPAMLVKYLDYIHAAARRFTNVRVNEADIPVFPDDMFSDGVHLNAKGGAQFSRRLAQCFQRTVFQTPCKADWEAATAAISTE